ncbi:hypothetical protein D3C73_1600890 [compost metagenome]
MLLKGLLEEQPPNRSQHHRRKEQDADHGGCGYPAMRFRDSDEDEKLTGKACQAGKAGKCE